MFQWQGKNSRNGQKPLYTFDEINDRTLRVTREYEGEIFKRDFSIGHQFKTYAELLVEMVCLKRVNDNPDQGYYLSVREITTHGYGKKTDVSIQNQIDKLYWDQKDDLRVAGEVSEKEHYIEGSVKKVLINRYERDPKARQACIDHYGASCQICSFDFSEKYGVHGEGYIEVHHIKPLSKIRESYSLDPVKDLIPVCSNCHSILHRGSNPITVEELKLMFAT